MYNASPSADAIPTLIALGATAHVLGSGGERKVAVEDIRVVVRTRIPPTDDELLVKLTLLVFPPKSGAIFLCFIPRNEMDIVVANVTTMVVLHDSGVRFESARIAIGAVAPKPLFVQEASTSLEGKEVNA